MCATSSRGLNGGIIVTHVRAVTVLLSGESSKLRFSLTYTDLDYTCEVEEVETEVETLKKTEQHLPAKKDEFDSLLVSPFLRLPSVDDSRSSCLLFDSSIQFRPFTINDSLSSTLLSIQFASPNHPSKASVQLSYLLPLVLLAFEFRDIDVSPPTSTQSGTNVL
ncbi:hypothetical protein QL285_033134 [Trifolium repens]|nr:hypothetical protein QL285_033134 [Trifolium repens]